MRQKLKILAHSSPGGAKWKRIGNFHSFVFKKNPNESKSKIFNHFP